MITPTLRFDTLKEIWGRGNDKAYSMVANMSEEQVRYALWCTMALLFGCPYSNSPDIVATSFPPHSKEMGEALLILASAGIGESCKEEVEAMEEKFKTTKFRNENEFNDMVEKDKFKSWRQV